MLLRGGEAVTRNSLYRSAYELFYTPLPTAKKRATKTLIDVGVDRVGTTIGSVGLLALVQLHLGHDLTTRVTGNHTLIVGKHDARRSMTLRVEGTGTISTEDGLVIEAKGGLTIKCGTTSIRVGADGIELNGSMVRATGENGGLEVGKEGLKLKSEGVLAHFGEKLLVKSEKASLAMGSEVKVDGQKILLNSPEQASDSPPPEPVPPTEIELVDHNGKPLAGQRFAVELSDGSQRTGVTDKNGKAKMDLPTGGRIRFPQLSEVEPA